MKDQSGKTRQPAQQFHNVTICMFTASVTDGFVVCSSTDKRTRTKMIQRAPTLDLIYAMTVHNDNSIDSLTSLAQIPAR